MKARFGVARRSGLLLLDAAADIYFVGKGFVGKDFVGKGSV